MLSEQGTEGDGGVNPGQEIYDGLSDEAKAAVDALPDDLFVGADGLNAARRMVQTIRMVDEINPLSWLLSPDERTNGRQMLSLIVGGTRCSRR